MSCLAADIAIQKDGLPHGALDMISTFMGLAKGNVQCSKVFSGGK